MGDLDGKVYVKLADGTEKAMRYDNECLEMAEDHLKWKIMGFWLELLQAKSDDERNVLMMKKLGFKEVRVLLYAGMKGAGSKVTLKQMHSKLQPSDLPYYTGVIFETLAKAFGGGEEAPEGTEGGEGPAADPPA